MLYIWEFFGISSLGFWVDLRYFEVMEWFWETDFGHKGFSFLVVERVYSRKQKHEYIFSMEVENRNRTASVS